MIAKVYSCEVCGRRYPSKADFRVIYDTGGNERYICLKCAPTSNDLERIIKEKSMQIKERRRHKRHPSHLLLFYRHVRDRTERRGVVRDISQGGMRFIAEDDLSTGEMLNLRVMSPLRDLEIRAVGLVRWIKHTGMTCEVGVKFVAKSRHMELEDRRRHPRIFASFYVKCFVKDRVLTCRVKDISQGGIRFICDEPLPLGIPIRIQLEATGCEVISHEYGIPMRVERVVEVLNVSGHRVKYQIRAKFVDEDL